MSGEHPSRPLRIWAVLGAHAGDNNQVIALAKALERPFEVKQLQFNGWRRLGPRLLGRSLLSLTSASRALILSEPPPDLTISSGHRSVPVVRALRRGSQGRTRSIHVGFPRISPEYFDLVIATPQYPIPDHPNFLRVPYALTPAALETPDVTDAAKMAALPRPRRLLIVGGPTLFWDLGETALLQRLLSMIDDARRDRGSVLVATSPRTPAKVALSVARKLGGSGIPFALAEPLKRPSLRSVLAAADTIAVTADSVSMVSDAIWTGKPVALIHVRKSVAGKLAFGLNDTLRPNRRLYPQDLRFFWRALSGIGISERLAKPSCSTADALQLIMSRVRIVLESIE